MVTSHITRVLFFVFVAIIFVGLSSYRASAALFINNKATCEKQGASCKDIFGPRGCDDGEEQIGTCDDAGGDEFCCIKRVVVANTPNAESVCQDSFTGAHCSGGNSCGPNEVKVGICGDGGNDCCKPAIGSPSTTVLQTSSTSYNYNPLEPIPGFESESKGADFPKYIEYIYSFAIWGVGIAAMFMVIVGGFWYLTAAGNTSQVGTAKTIIKDALLGLVIAISAWLILYIINPDLVNIKLDSLKNLIVSGTTTQTAQKGPTSGGGGTAPPTSSGNVYTNTEAVAKLSSAGIGVTSSGNCSNSNDSSCTSLDGIPKSTIDNLINLKNTSGCSFNVTGGTETGHASHGYGLPVVDVTQTSCLSSTLQNPSSINITKICATSSYSNLSYNCGSYTESAPHFHLVFTP